ncbi:2-hydroxyacid dehydrogenase [Microvirga lenta]|uniref:2-hydroxyacid dehydrogenase n=1 Tax=Microvirga lenta TaxID=2881337 RepID=UPI001CFF73E6|nr:2-hydroxyacid dehydrogenase [Microvirga lenta]MCB5175844.1 2-hydroxyacid dehydrogenase [Microvirga lenta]
MRVTVFSAKPYDRRFLGRAGDGSGHELSYLEPRLSLETSGLAAGAEAVCAFVNDEVNRDVLASLPSQGVRLVALRSAGFNNVDLEAARDQGITVARVPAYSPYAVAEHTVALILTLNRKTHRAYNRVREGNFALDGLLGFDLAGKTAGVVGTGKIGEVVSKILLGFGCTVLAYDPQPNPVCEGMGVRYVPMEELLFSSHIVSLHCPLTPATHHLIGAEALRHMKPGMMLINTSRGAVVDTRAVLRGLKEGIIGSLGLDVYEEEGDLFFEDLSQRFISDDVFARLLTFPNVLITGHQAFFTEEALTNIAETTIANITSFERTGRAVHEVSVERIAREGKPSTGTAA